MGTNMLSAKKVKLHGLQDKRWTVQDHLTQYKGLVTLFKRDKKIVDIDTKLNLKKQKKEYKQLTRQIALNREDLKNCMYGDQQRVRNILAEDRNMKLAYQELHVSKVIDHIYQDNFSRRKMLDLQNYRLKLKIDKLIKLRLEEGDLEMQSQCTVKPTLELMIGVVTGKVQDMILKKEAAITVKTTYKTLIDIMRKDAIYYDAVLETLKEDALAQGECLIQSTTLGQLATEYVDDRRCEFEALQACVKEDMKIRVRNLAEVKTQIDDTVKNLRGLIRRDSDITTCIQSHIPATPSWVMLQRQIQEFTDLLQILKEVTLVSNFECIFPCMKEQARQSERLGEFVKQNEESNQRLQVMKAHAEVIANNLENSTVETTAAYKETKRELKQKIADEQLRKEQMSSMCEKRGKVLVEIRKVLQHLQHITSKIQTEPRLPKIMSVNALRQTYAPEESASEESVILPPLEPDGLKVIPIIRSKINVLLGKFFEYDKGTTEATALEAEQMYMQLINKTAKMLDMSAVVAESDLLEGLMFEDALIPTREFIKAESEQIVTRIRYMEEMMP